MWLLVATARCCLRVPAASRLETLTPEKMSYRRIPSREVEEQNFRVLDTG
jgi:hypothetical protein